MKPATLTKVLGVGLLFVLLLFMLHRCNRDQALWRAMTLADTQAVEMTLRSNPALAKKPLSFGNDLPLSRAATSRNPKAMIDLLIANGADVNARSGGFNLTPLQEAVWNANPQAVRALLAHKPDVNALDGDKRTALHYAISAFKDGGSEGTNNVGKEIMELLLANGADINHGYPILLSASSYANNTGLMAFLLSKGANVNVQQPYGRETPLELAIISGNKDLVQILLRYHPDLRRQRGSYGTPLSIAIEKERQDIALLIQQDVLQRRSNTVSFAAARGNLDALHRLLQNNPLSISEKDELGFTPLHWAAVAGRSNTAEALISQGGDMNAVDAIELHPLEWAAFMGHLALVRLFAERGGSDSGIALFFAVQQRNTSVATFLLEHGADASAHSQFSTVTALHLAARQGNIELARLLLEHGARVNAEEHNHSTPLEYAIFHTSSAMVELLFEHGAIIPEKSSGYWSIFHHWALGPGDTNVAEVLLSHKGDINAKGTDGQTPLHFAARQGELQGVEWLLSRGADVNARDNNGKTPLGLLHGRQGRITRKDIAELLKKHGGRE